ncbi:MAG: hypothetical protein KJ023_15135 [Burkholderiaceae bacterium]|nr:hypothetical protein [Burkholderiaceae bacterium]
MFARHGVGVGDIGEAPASPRPTRRAVPCVAVVPETRMRWPLRTARA